MKNKNLIDLLYNCAAACNNCSTACLQEKNVEKMAECIRLDMDCAQICTLTATFIARNSDHAKHLMKECAEICRKCAAECKKHSQMEHCRICAEACDACASECKIAA